MSELARWVVEYLLNALWQAPLVLLAAWVAARMLRGMGARAEHRVWVMALAVEAVLPACMVQPLALLHTLWHANAGGHGEVRVLLGGGVAGGGVPMRHWALMAVAVAYLAGVVYLALRFAWRALGTRSLVASAERAVLTLEQERVWRRLCAWFDVYARAAISAKVTGPATVARTVLFPAAFIERLSEQDWEAVAAHELAHVRRRDFAKNLLYEAMALPAAMHPAVWVTRRMLAETREMVCDAIAAEAVAGRERYVRSLLRLASLVAESARAQPFHAIGIFDARNLERRVMNLTSKASVWTGARRLLMAAACMTLGVVTCGTAMALHMEVAAPLAQEQMDTANPVQVSPATMAANCVYKKQPVYPVEAKVKQDTVNGPVVLHVVIGKDGDIKEIQVAKSLRRDYDLSALEAVRDWKYKPYLLNGHPVEVDTMVTITYSIAQ